MITQKKQLLFEKQAEIAKAVSHPFRVAILDFLKDGEQCVCDIAEHVGAERSNVSRHLSVMVGAGVLGCRKEGLKIIYKLKTQRSEKWREKTDIDLKVMNRFEDKTIDELEGIKKALLKQLKD